LSHSHDLHTTSLDSLVRSLIDLSLSLSLFSPPHVQTLTRPIPENLPSPTENDEIVSLGDSFFSSRNSDVDDGELSYPPTSSSMKFVTRAEVTNRSKAGDTGPALLSPYLLMPIDSEESLKSQGALFTSLQKQHSQVSATGLSGQYIIFTSYHHLTIVELAKGLTAGTGLGLKPWDSRSHLSEVRDCPTPSTLHTRSFDHRETLQSRQSQGLVKII
jgi:hypothetical protein